MRGIERPYTFLVKYGFAAQTATDWSQNYIGCVRAEKLEKLCMLLNCTPNDLFEWREDNKTVVPDGHALRDIPADKLEKLGEMLAELKKD